MPDEGAPGADLIDALGAISTPVAARVEEDVYHFDGFVDFYGYRTTAAGWFVSGWVAHPWPVGYRPEKAVALFADRSMAACTFSLFHHREDLSGRGIGFLFFFPGTTSKSSLLLSTLVEAGGTPRPLYPAKGQRPLDEGELIRRLEGMVAGGEPGSQRRAMRDLLLGAPEDGVATGFIDFYGYHGTAGGWLFSGWMSAAWAEGDPPGRMVVSFDEGDIEGEAFAVHFPRRDLPGGATGVAFIVRGGASQVGKLSSVSFRSGGVRATLSPAPEAPRLREHDLISRFRPSLDAASASGQRDILAGLLGRQPYRGEDTMAALNPAVFLEVDEAILCGPDGLVLMGWCLALPNEISEIRVRCGSRSTTLNLDDCVRVDRPDVIEAMGRHGFSDPRCGFVAFLPASVTHGGRIYIEIETARRDVGYQNIPKPRLEGLAAIKRLLSAVDVRFEQVQHAFDVVLGPAVEALNRDRLATRSGYDAVDFGVVPAAPRFSVVVPLHGRLDFVEYQLALFSAGAPHEDVEFVYVLDDPDKRREARFLFASVFARFRIPFRVLFLDRNVGYAPANNIGLSVAHGAFVAFVNSDVFPDTPDWLERLSGRLMADPSIGAAGPLLLYEDGSVQHRGMYFARLPEFGGWHFGMHLDKGMRPDANQHAEEHISITGACMVMTRELAQKLGGFDEIYAVGDFEDSDLCLKLREHGYRCVVDPEIRLLHLERKSQAASVLGWRMNLTLYNAWQHERRWGETIEMPRKKSHAATGRPQEQKFRYQPA